jgi:pyruvate/2-oxoglutarate dehydrogenase complex dihydrolipoamide dehydrogenase (E3) component
VPGLDAAGPLTNIEALELDYVPQHLIVLGGGYVGLEMAQAYRRFGSRVTIIEHGPQLAGREDPDVADEMRRILSDEGIDILVAAEIRRVQGRSGEDVSLLMHTSSGEQTIEGSDILVAAGRSPNTAGIGLEVAGVEWTVMATLKSTSAWRPVRPRSGRYRTTRDRLVPYCMFTDPPLARVGLSEGEAQRQGIEVRVAKLPMSAVLRTHTIDAAKVLPSRGAAHAHRAFPHFIRAAIVTVEVIQ